MTVSGCDLRVPGRRGLEVTCVSSGALLVSAVDRLIWPGSWLAWSGLSELVSFCP